MERIRNWDMRQADLVGKCVRHFVFGEGTIIGIPGDREGIIVQFDCIPVPRTISASAKLEFLS